MLKIGTKAPEFTLMDQSGTPHSLKNYAGKWVLIYFYPKDDTPGCTAEACSFRDNFPHFEKMKLQVFGISADSVKSHANFAQKYNLSFVLLSDETKEVIKKYEAGGIFTKRISYLIDPAGVIKKAYSKVNPRTHAEDVIQDLVNP